MLLWRAKDSALGEGGGGGGQMGMEKPTTDEVESEGLEVEAAPASQDSNGLFRTDDVDAGTGVAVGVGAGVHMIDKFSLTAHGATMSRCVVFPRG